jgi:hypothetical protein
MYQPPTPDNLIQQRTNIDKESRIIIWLTGCLYKNQKVRTTSKKIAELFNKKGWDIEELGGEEGYNIKYPAKFNLD